MQHLWKVKVPHLGRIFPKWKNRLSGTFCYQWCLFCYFHPATHNFCGCRLLDTHHTASPHLKLEIIGTALIRHDNVDFMGTPRFSCFFFFSIRSFFPPHCRGWCFRACTNSFTVLCTTSTTFAFLFAKSLVVRKADGKWRDMCNQNNTVLHVLVPWSFQGYFWSIFWFTGICFE